MDARRAPVDDARIHWRQQLPVLTAGEHTLRQLRPSDAAPLLAMLTSDDVTRHISPPPLTLDGFERFVAWSLREQAAGTSICYGIVPKGYDCAVGIIQIRGIQPDLGNAEWGFALGCAFWGTGVFHPCATAVVNFAIETIGIRRLEARAAAANARGNGALCKLGASPEGVLQNSFLKNGRYHDQLLWAIVESEWREDREAESMQDR
jgi:RimJ/RimL family protein N-acetyltransferase